MVDDPGRRVERGIGGRTDGLVERPYDPGMADFTPHPWKLTFETSEDEDHCEMVVHLDAGDRSLSGHGRSRRKPGDPATPQVGEELAAARALHELANHLTDDAWVTIETFSPPGN